MKEDMQPSQHAEFNKDNPLFRNLRARTLVPGNRQSVDGGLKVLDYRVQQALGNAQTVSQNLHQSCSGVSESTSSPPEPAPAAHPRAQSPPSTPGQG